MPGPMARWCECGGSGASGFFAILTTTRTSPTGRKFSPFILPLVFVVIGGLLCSALLLTGPKTATETDVRPPRIVKTVVVEPSDEHLTVKAFGSVIPARKVVVKPEVPGRVVRQNVALEPGDVVTVPRTLF